MVIEPVGTRKGDGEGGGGYSMPLIVLRWILIVDRVGEVILFNDVMVLEPCIFVANRAGDVMETPAVTLDVTKLFMLPVRELKWKHPILLAVIVPLDKKDVDMVLIVAV